MNNIYIIYRYLLIDFIVNILNTFHCYNVRVTAKNYLNLLKIITQFAIMNDLGTHKRYCLSFFIIYL